MFFVAELLYLMSEIEPFGLWILTKLGNVFRAKHMWRVIVFTETKVTKAATVTTVTTGILQKHRSTGNVNKKRVTVVRF
jgi:AICAR transformylase/IMP cyclohydrolase PurH